MRNATGCTYADGCAEWARGEEREQALRGYGGQCLKQVGQVLATARQWVPPKIGIHGNVEEWAALSARFRSSHRCSAAGVRQLPR